MNDVLDDGAGHGRSPDDSVVIARLRSALDELTAGADVDSVPSPAPAGGRLTTGRWLAIAAATILVVGAATAVVVNRNHAPETASSPTEVATTAPAPTTTATEPTLIRIVTPWYTLVSPDLVPGEIATVPNQLTDETSVAWALGGNPVDGLFILRSGPGSPDMAPADTSLAGYQMIGDQAVAVSSYGIDAQQQADLMAQVQPGSGLPWVLPVDGWTYLGMGTGNDGPTQQQTYSSGSGTVTIEIGPLANQFLTLATVGDIQEVVVTGRNGWKATNDNGIYVLWPAGDSGQWASLTISESLADRVDGLIAAVAEVDPTQPTVESVPVPDTSAGAVVGQLVVPSIDIDWFVVGLGDDLAASAEAGPVLIEGPSPDAASTDSMSIVWGNRTTHGAPFFDIDLLLVGDTIRWEGQDGTATFEVLGSASGADPDALAVPAGTALELRAYTPKYTKRETLVVFARRVDLIG